MEPDAVDQEIDLPAETPEEVYAILLRALQRKRGFGLFFVQCSPHKGNEIIANLRQDLPQKRMQVLQLDRASTTLYDRVEALWQQQPFDVLFIQGLENSLLEYEDTKRIAGWTSKEIYSYSWKGVPRILSHLNQQRERFRDNFNCSFVFLVPLFGIKYFIQRAPDFFDWRSGIFQFPRDPQEVAQESQRVLLEGDYEKHLLLPFAERWQKILHIRELLENPHQTPDRKVGLLTNLGVLLYVEQDYENVIAAFDQIIHFRPDDHEAWFCKGFTLYDLGRYKDAIDAYDQALQLQPDDHKAWYYKGNALSALGCYEEAVSAFDQAIQYKSDCYEAWYGKGVALWNLEQNEAAVLAFDQAIQYKADDHQAWYFKGLILLILDRHEEAAVAFDQAIHFKPDYYEAWYNKGNILLDLGRYKEAITAFDQAIHFKPDYYEAWYDKGIALSDLGRYEDAIATYNQVICFKPNLYEAWYNKGVTLSNLKRYEEALASYENALPLNRSLPWQGCGFVLMQLGRYPEALESFDRAIELESNTHTAWYNKACCLALQGNIIEAIDSLSRAIELYPKYRELAKIDRAFNGIRDEDWFRAVVEGEDNERAADLD